MAENRLQVNNIYTNSTGLLNSTAFRANTITNPFAKSIPKDSFELSQKDNPSTVNIEQSKKFNFNELQKKFYEFLQAKSFNALANKNEIENMIVSNPEINKILTNNGIKKEICVENLSSIYNSHLADTVNISRGIAQNMQLSKEDTKIIEKAALFHDFGKVLIPREILEKPSALTPEEKRIVSKHAILGYELLKTTGMEPEVLEIIKNHHKDKMHLDNSYISTLSQIITVADIYSALTTKRSYKNSMSQNEAVKILDKLCDDGKLDKNVVEALKISLNDEKIAA